MLSEEILSLAEYIKTRNLYPPVVKTGYPPEDILLSDSRKNRGAAPQIYPFPEREYRYHDTLLRDIPF